MELRLFRDMFGRWQWHLLAQDRTIVRESDGAFGSSEECLEDARGCGCAGPDVKITTPRDTSARGEKKPGT